MNIIEYLTRQHEEVRDVLGRMIAEDDAHESRVLVAQLSRVLRLHLRIEEKIVYPAASKAFEGDDDEEESVLEAYEEHAVARRCLEALEATAPRDRRFIVRARVLKGILDKHFDEEENSLFPEFSGKIGPNALAGIGEQVERRLPELEEQAQEAIGRSRVSHAKRTRGAGQSGSRPRGHLAPRGREA
jgi:hemerythrin-like domain-containing protein